MELKLKEIAKIVEGQIIGDENIIIRNADGLSSAGHEDISFLSDLKYLRELEKTCAGAIIVPETLSNKVTRSIAKKNLVKVKNPYFAFTKILKLLNEEKKMYPQGIHPTAIIGKNVKLGKNVALGAYTIISDDAEIDEGTIIYPHCYIGNKTKIGKNCLIYPRVCIREGISVGDQVIIHSGTVIGSDGFGFLPHPEATLGHHKIPQIGTVEIGNDVEIGANCTIDRATVGKTKIGRGTKIDNLVQIAHNVEIGENCLIVAQVGIAGSTKIGKNVILAGQAGVTDHVTIGNNVKVGGRAGVISNLPSGVTVSGFPAREHHKMLKIQALTERLPEMYTLFRKILKRKMTSKRKSKK